MRSAFCSLFFVALLFIESAFAETSDRTVVKIGVIVPLTGSAALWGLDARGIFPLLAEEWNSSSKKYRYVFLLEDGNCGVSNAATTAAHKLLDVDRVQFLVVGCSGEMLQVGPIAERQRRIAIAFAASHPAISELGDYLFRTYPDIRLGIAQMVRYWGKHGRHRIALLSEENPFPLGIKTELQKIAAESILTAEDFHVDEMDFRTLLQKVAAKSPDAYFLNAASPTTYARLITQLKELGIREDIFAYHQPSDSSSINNLGERQNGVIFFAAPDLEGAAPDFQKLRDQYKAEHKEDFAVPFLGASSFNALAALHQTIEAVGTDTTKAKDYLYQHTFNGALGPLTFDAHGDIVGASFVLKTIAAGAVKTLDEQP